MTTAHILEQKITNAKIAEDVLNESNWSDIYSPECNQQESPSEITTSTVSELDGTACSLLEDRGKKEQDYLYKIHPDENTPRMKYSLNLIFQGGNFPVTLSTIDIFLLVSIRYICLPSNDGPNGQYHPCSKYE